MQVGGSGLRVRGRSISQRTLTVSSNKAIRERTRHTVRPRFTVLWGRRRRRGAWDRRYEFGCVCGCSYRLSVRDHRWLQVGWQGEIGKSSPSDFKGRLPRVVPPSSRMRRIFGIHHDRTGFVSRNQNTARSLRKLRLLTRKKSCSRVVVLLLCEKRQRILRGTRAVERWQRSG